MTLEEFAKAIPKDDLIKWYSLPRWRQELIASEIERIVNEDKNNSNDLDNIDSNDCR